MISFFQCHFSSTLHDVYIIEKAVEGEFGKPVSHFLHFCFGRFNLCQGWKGDHGLVRLGGRIYLVVDLFVIDFSTLADMRFVNQHSVGPVCLF